MREYLSLGYMNRVNELKGKIKIFLPYHAIKKNDSVTIKTRIVFDASSKNAKRKSLNDALYKGHILQLDLFSIIIRSRCFKYILCANIAKMYRQIHKYTKINLADKLFVGGKILKLN